MSASSFPSFYALNLPKMSNELSLKDLKELLDDNEIDLSARQLTKIPRNLTQLPRATTIDLSNNKISLVPSEFCTKMSRVTRLELGSNRLAFLPDTIGSMTSINHLDLYNNEIEDLPLEFANLKSLKWLDLKKNPLEPGLAKAAGNCGSEKECQEAARRVVAYMTERKREHDKQVKLQEQLAAKTKQLEEPKHAPQAELNKKTKKARAAEEREQQEKLRREKEAMAKQTKKQQHQQNHPADKKQDKQKNVPQKKGRGVIGTLFRWAFFLAFLSFGAATVVVLMNCANGGKTVPNSQALCKDLTQLSQFKAPGPKFVENLKSTYGTVYTIYKNKAVRAYGDFAKTEVGQQVAKYLHIAHAYIVEYTLLASRYIQQAYDAFLAWWARDGEKMFGKIVENIKVAAKVVFEVVKDLANMAVEALKVFVDKLNHFVADVSDHGFSKAFERALKH